ncbi:beta-1,3-galactosyltransferase 1-like [Mercenaria mercenaria]|uniref:beta-1,3-galactosyltransferase 1-like n=1 Tax=Mercenaria mercenaria TaxID=6596 RepID=UPI00234E8B5D|nr:beta-1,3-galactosyltransferase 1-like [Mercenaria mercenaria]
MMKKFKIRFVVIILMILVIIFMILPYVCYTDTRMRTKDNCGVSRLNLIIAKPYTENAEYSIKRVGTVETETYRKYDFQRELELEKRERFERRKDELLYRLERSKARVFDKSIDIGEPFPAVADEMAKVQGYYNLSDKKMTILNSKYLIESKSICSETPELMVLVPSVPTNENVRSAIRKTYGLIAHYTPSDLLNYGMEHPVKIAFLLGRSPNHSVEIDVINEQERYKDIVQVDFVDSYYNLTLKILYGFKWVSTFCKGVKYVLKSDEDVFVNVKLLLAELKTYRVSPRGSVFGFIHSTSFGLRVLKTGKWGVSEAEYPLRRYPPYAQGTSYTLTGDLIPKIVETAQHLPYLHIEDAFITGIIAGKILGANLERMSGNSYWSDTIPDPCEFVKTERVSQTNMVPSLMYKTWKALLSPDTVCANVTYHPRMHRYNWRIKSQFIKP